MMKPLYLLAFIFILSACAAGIAGISQYRTADGGIAYKVECSPLESDICNEKAHNFCASQGKKVKVLDRDVTKKYGSSSLLTHKGGFDIQENSSGYGRSYIIEVLEGHFTCVS